MSDKLIELARECGASSTPIWGPPTVTFTADQLATFRARIRAEAMEEAAKLCMEYSVKWARPDGSLLLSGMSTGAEECSIAIRAKAGVEGALK